MQEGMPAALPIIFGSSSWLLAPEHPRYCREVHAGCLLRHDGTAQ